MTFGFGVLKLAPNAFWGMTLREIAAVVDGLSDNQVSMGRDRFLALMRAHPDRRRNG